MKKMMLTALAVAGLTVGLAAPVAAAPGGDPGRPSDAPDVACLQAGISGLQSLDALTSVAKDGLPIATALALGVTVRPGADISGVPDPIPFNLVLSDHLAGDQSLFVYPYCP